MEIGYLDKKISKAVHLVSYSQIYQKRLFGLLIFAWVEICICTLIVPFVLTNPLFICGGIRKSENYFCSHSSIEDCRYENDFTGTYYSGLYCENQNMRMSLQSVLPLGILIGSFLTPALSDTRGKRLIGLICFTFSAVGSILLYYGILQKVYFLIGVGLLFLGFSNGSIGALSYSINSDFFSDERRKKALIYYFSAWGLTDTSGVIFYYLLPNWKYFLAFLLIIPSLIIVAFFYRFFLQSVHYLVNVKEDFQQSRKVITKLALTNQATQSHLDQSLEILKQIQDAQQKNYQQAQKGFQQIFVTILKTKKYLKALVCIATIRIAFVSFYYGTQAVLERTGYNLGLSLTFFGFGQISGYFIGVRFIPKIRRKLSLFSSALGLTIVLSFFMINFIIDSPLLSTVALYIGVMFSSFLVSTLTLVQSQSFPSEIRATCVGLIFGIAFSIRMVLPYVIGYFNQRGMHPTQFSFFCLLTLGLFPIYILEQTLEKESTEGVEEEKIGSLQMKIVNDGKITVRTIDQF